MAGGDVTVSEASVIKADVPIGGEGPAFQDTMPLATAHNSGIGDVATSEKMDIEDESVHIGSGNIHVAEKEDVSESHSVAAPEVNSPLKRFVFVLFCLIFFVGLCVLPFISCIFYQKLIFCLSVVENVVAPYVRLRQ